jgi:hypothetical protein
VPGQNPAELTLGLFAIASPTRPRALSTSAFVRSHSAAPVIISLAKHELDDVVLAERVGARGKMSSDCINNPKHWQVAEMPAL